MLVLMRAVLSGVLMVAPMRIDTRFIRMFVQMRMHVFMGVFVSMDFFTMPVCMAVGVGVLMEMQVFMFGGFFHDRLLVKISPETLLVNLQYLSGPSWHCGLPVARQNFLQVLGTVAGADQR
jgi:hypothetical protein